MAKPRIFEGRTVLHKIFGTTLPQESIRIRDAELVCMFPDLNRVLELESLTI